MFNSTPSCYVLEFCSSTSQAYIVCSVTCDTPDKTDWRVLESWHLNVFELMLSSCGRSSRLLSQIYLLILASAEQAKIKVVYKIP